MGNTAYPLSQQIADTTKTDPKVFALQTAGNTAHAAADMVHGLLATAGAVESRQMLAIMARLRGAADDLQQLAADVEEDQKPA